MIYLDDFESFRTLEFKIIIIFFFTEDGKKLGDEKNI